MKYENKKTHNMIFVMLDPRFKSLWILSSFVGWEQGVSLVEKYDRKSLYPMSVKCYEHLHPLIRSNIQIFPTKIFFNQDCNLDIFEQTTSTSKPVKSLSRGNC
jgi:hypothetical protein